jgi:hypothetical protein
MGPAQPDPADRSYRDADNYLETTSSQHRAQLATN